MLIKITWLLFNSQNVERCLNLIFEHSRQYIYTNFSQTIMSSLSGRFSDNQKTPSNLDSRAIVFIDSRLSNCDTLIQQVILEARVIVIGLKDDGIREITRILNSTCSQEVYLISHGSPGCLYLGNSELSLNTLIHYELELQSWFRITSPDNNSSCPKLFLSGCDVAAGDAGEELMTKLNSITGAIIAASVSIISTNIFN